MSLSESSEARKARLISLRRKRAGDTSDDTQAAVLSMRNFDPETRTLRKRNPQDIETLDTVEKDVDGLTEKIVAEDEEKRAQDLDLFNIAPKRANWDLKRDMEKKLAKLDRQTQQAIHTLIRQRLAAQKGQSDDLVGTMQAEAGPGDDPLSDDED